MKSNKKFFEKLFAVIPKAMFIAFIVFFVFSALAVLYNVKVFRPMSLAQIAIVIVAGLFMLLSVTALKKVIPPKIALAVVYAASAGVSAVMILKDISNSNNLLLFKKSWYLDAGLYGIAAALLAAACVLILMNYASSGFFSAALAFNFTVSLLAFVVPYLNIALFPDNKDAAFLSMTLLVYCILLMLFDKEVRYVIVAEDPKTKIKDLNTRYKKGLLTDDEYQKKLADLNAEL